MKKGLVQVMLANILCMLISIVTNFMLPRFLSIETYNIIKSYTLYLSYAGLFAFGYTDGIYLKYGGKQIDRLNCKELSRDFATYSIFQLALSATIAFVATFCHNELMIVFSCGLLVTNLGGYLKILYQATGVFGNYGKALNLEKVVVFLANVFLIFLIKTDNSSFYLMAQILGPILTLGYLMVTFKKYCKGKLQIGFSIRTFWENIQAGFVLTVGGVADILFTGLDRWFIKLLMGTREFALYSFAVSLENIISTFTAPISITFYNYFCRNIDVKQVKKIKDILLLFGFLLMAALFPAKWVVENHIPKYVDSIDVIFYLFVAQFFYMIIRSVYVNIYKARKNQSEYLKQIIAMLILAFLTNAAFYVLIRSMEAFAIATCFTSIVWFFLCEFKNKEIRFPARRYLCIAIMLGCLLLFEKRLSTTIAFFAYILTAIVVSFIFLREAMHYCFIMVISRIKDFPK